MENDRGFKNTLARIPQAMVNHHNRTVDNKNQAELINMGQEIVPHVHTVRGRYQSYTHTYSHPDEALLANVANAHAMENDLLIRECIESRMRAVCQQDIDVEPIDLQKNSKEERDQWEEENQQSWKKVNTNHWDAEALAEKVKVMKMMEKRPTQRLYALMNAIWFGRYGVENIYGKKYIEGVGYVKNVIIDWRPKHGDKYIFRFDDGTHRAEEGQVAIRVSTSADRGRQRQFTDRWGKRHNKIIPTQYGLAYVLDPIEEQATTIHKHIIEDGFYEDPRKSGSIYGVGIRSRIYWTWFQMTETLKIMLNYLERTGLGIEIWKYPSNNPRAKQETERMMKERGSSGYSAFLVPVQPGEDQGLYQPEIIEPGPGGIGEMNEFYTQRYHDQIKRYILGQKLTSETDSTGMNANIGDIHLATLADIVRFDSNNLEDTETETVRHQQIKTFPGSDGIHLQFKLKSRSAEMDQKLEAMEKAHSMGFNIKPEQLGDVLGLAEAAPGEGLLDRQQAQQAAMGGMPGQNPMFQGSDLSPENQATFPEHMMNGAGEEGQDPVNRVKDLIGAASAHFKGEQIA